MTTTRLRIPVLIAAAFAALTIAGCSTGNATPTAGTSPASAASEAAKPSPTTAPTLDAKAVLDKLSTAGLPMSNGAVQDENTDPNNLLGRPNEYTSRASFDVQGGDSSADKYGVDRGGVTEVFPDAASAKARADYIAGVQKAGGPILGTEYHYLAGPVLVRITGKIKPSVAAKFQAAVAGLIA